MEDRIATSGSDFLSASVVDDTEEEEETLRGSPLPVPVRLVLRDLGGEGGAVPKGSAKDEAGFEVRREEEDCTNEAMRGLRGG